MNERRRNPIESLVDHACGISPCVAPVKPLGLVLLRCPKCKREKRARKEQSDPPDTAVVELCCPECVGSNWEQIAYYDKGGREILPA